ncbi:MAG TPA: sulfatase-like hydrolase/transferase [Casimicrobiaceae bacterium]|nr:sulfatase-like hydrolase/transferase [Casimicrobiaceae bacterium]
MRDLARTNLLFLFSDQHAQRVGGAYGDATGATPNLDRLASEGVVFDNVYCPSPLCVPSRMAMLTARHPYEQECWTNDDYLRSDAPTWVHGAGAAGYRPVLAGRLHSMGPDQLHGYAERMVGDHSPNWGGVPRHDLGVLDKANDPWPESLARSGVGQSAYQVKDAETASAACAFLRNVAKQRTAGNHDPFCLTVGFLLPHPPYVAWRDDYERFQGRVPPAANAAPPPDVHPWEAWWRSDRGIADVAPSVAMRARTAYYGLVHRLDAMIGDILQCLRECGLDENTLVVYTTDHGDQLGERGLWWKHTLFEDSVRVPLIMRWPGCIAPGERRPQVANLIDVAATMLDALGGVPLPRGRGRSLLPVARDRRSPWNDETFSEHCTDVVPAWTGGRATQQRMIRRGRFKLIYYHGYAPQLFDLDDDPHERQDLAHLPHHAKTRDELLARVVEDWDPDAIAARIRARRLEKDVIDRWAQHVRPQDAFRWNLLPEHNRLEAETGQ